MNLIEQLETEEINRLNKNIPDFSPGDTVIVNVNVVEGDRKRVQAYEGVVIAKRNRGLNSSFIVPALRLNVAAKCVVQSYIISEIAQENQHVSVKNCRLEHKLQKNQIPL